MSILTKVIRKIGGFGLSTIISGLVGVLIIPFVITYAGVEAWTAIAVAQAVGALISTFAMYGWGITGPTDIAVINENEKGDYYYQSLLSRFWLTAILSVIAAIITTALVSEFVIASVIIAVSGVVGAMTAGWFFVGESSPSRLLYLDTLPRAGAVVVGLILLRWTGEIVDFAISQLAGSLLAAALGSISVLGRHKGWKFSLSPIQAIKNLQGQSSQIVITSTAAVYVNMPLIIVQIFLPAATTVYALADRIIKLGLVVLRPIIQVAQGWVPDKDQQTLLKNVRVVTRFALLFGLFTGVIYTLLSNWAGLILSRDEISIPFDLSLPLGIAVGAMTATQFIGFAALNALHKTKELAISVVTGAVTALLLLPAFVLLLGVQGVAISVAAAELVVLLYQLVVVSKTLRVET
ncbi:MAG: polysaccharide biosynthesis C-terminal domain-containing protein [Microbacteriaceae bacterium]|nr:polysaccharide biosynthesis C-terminal domain-containing protein [Microbacteriaceae bacterium]